MELRWQEAAEGLNGPRQRARPDPGLHQGLDAVAVGRIETAG
jgi:hypothetical protein